MRVKPATLKIIKELKCVKCRKTVIVPPEMKEAAKSGTINTGVTKPAAPKMMAPPPVAKPVPIPVKIVPPMVVVPPGVAPKAAPKTISTPQPVAQPVVPPPTVAPVQPTPPEPASVVIPGLLDARISKLEKTVAELESRIAGLLKAEQQAAQQLASELEKL